MDSERLCPFPNPQKQEKEKRRPQHRTAVAGKKKGKATHPACVDAQRTRMAKTTRAVGENGLVIWLGGKWQK
jgi:hypothetical protein